MINKIIRYFTFLLKNPQILWHYHLNRMSSRKKCYVCKKTFYSFLPFKGGSSSFSSFVMAFVPIGSDTDNYACIFCSASDRERHLFMYFDKLELWNRFSDSTVLHVAPEKHLREKIKTIKPSKYVQGDMMRYGGEVENLDCTKINYPDDFFDVIICNHVLEHIPNDQLAMKEFFRVLKPSGIAILQTPFSSLLYNSFEDPNINTDELRLFFYGQHDHVRVYGNDLFRKLQSIGFKLNIKKHNECFRPIDSFYYGVNALEDLILVEKR